MDSKLINKVTAEFTQVKHPVFKVGDLIEVYTKIKEGDKERIQIFKGIVIAIKGGGISKTFTIRKISYGVGVEKIFPLYAPVIDKIKVIKRGKVRRSKLYYLRARVGKEALKTGLTVPKEGEDLETLFDNEKKEAETKEKETSKEKIDTDKKKEEQPEKQKSPQEEKKDKKTEKSKA